MANLGGCICYVQISPLLSVALKGVLTQFLESSVCKLARSDSCRHLRPHSPVKLPFQICVLELPFKTAYGNTKKRDIWKVEF